MAKGDIPTPEAPAPRVREMDEDASADMIKQFQSGKTGRKASFLTQTDRRAPRKSLLGVTSKLG